MPHIIVKADTTDADTDGPVMLRERVNVSDFESGHFAAQLVERINWAVGDAAEVERGEDGEVRRGDDGEVQRGDEVPHAEAGPAREERERDFAIGSAAL